MVANSGFLGASLAVAIVMASGGMLAGDAVAQENAAVQDDGAAQSEMGRRGGAPAGSSVSDTSPGVDAGSRKADLDRSGLRVETAIPLPRPTLTSTRSVVVPKILGSYR